jgi:hypothetical protein
LWPLCIYELGLLPNFNIIKFNKSDFCHLRANDCS